jgi:predicted ATPase/class 3 adenylate cyclase
MRLVSALSVAGLLFTDIEGSSALVGRLGVRYERVLERHHEIIRGAVAGESGVEQSREGDSLFITFTSATAALEAAIEAQRRVEREPWPPDARVRVRMGLHVGEVAASQVGLVGLAIHQAARIMSAAHGGQIVVSGDVVRQVGEFRGEVVMRPLGRYDLRDVGRVELFQVEHPQLQRVFPELRTKRAVGHNLPVPMTSLVGRVAETEVVSAMLDAHRLVTLLGEGGCGKTRLALSVAGAELGRFVDGVWFVDLAPVSAGADVAPRVAAVFGVVGGLDELVSALEQREVLLVLDNCEHVLESAATMVARVLGECATTTVLATSRTPLDVAGEARYPVPALEVPRTGVDLREAETSDAVKLFVARAQLVRPGYRLGGRDAAAIVELCVRLDGLPLAIELAAARLRGMSLEELVSRIDDRFGVLVGGPHTAPERQRTLGNTLEWSFRLLDAEERHVLRQVSVFRGGCDAESAAAVSGDVDTPNDVREVLIRLVDKSLVTVLENDGATRYGIHETIREYALGACSEDERESFRTRHARWYATLASQLTRGPAAGGEQAWISRHDAERDNFRAAAEWLRVHDPQAALRLLLDIEPGMDLTAQSRWVYQLIGRVLPHAPGAPVADRAHGLVELALGDRRPRDPDALRLCAEAFELLGEVDDPAVECAVLAAVARCHADAADGQLDADEVAAAVAAGDRAGGTYWPIMVRRFLSYRAPPSIAEALNTDAIRLTDQLGLDHFGDLIRRDLAVIAMFRGDSSEALATFRRLGSVLDADNLCFYALAEGEHDELAVGIHIAEHLVLDLTNGPHDPAHAAALHTVIAHLHRLAGDLERCEASLDMATGTDERSLFPRMLELDETFVGGMSMVTRSALLRLRGQPRHAAEVIEPACRHVGTQGVTDIAMRVLEELAVVASALGRRHDASDLLATANQARNQETKPPSPAWHSEIDTLRHALADLHGTPLDASSVRDLARSMARTPSQ